MKDDRGGHRHSQVGLHGPAGSGAGHQEERAPVATGRLQDVVAGAQRSQPDRLCAIQLRGEEKQPEEGLLVQSGAKMLKFYLDVRWYDTTVEGKP